MCRSSQGAASQLLPANFDMDVNSPSACQSQSEDPWQRTWHPCSNRFKKEQHPQKGGDTWGDTWKNSLLGTCLEMHPWKERLHARAGTRLRDCGLWKTLIRAEENEPNTWIGREKPLHSNLSLLHCPSHPWRDWERLSVMHCKNKGGRGVGLTLSWEEEEEKRCLPKYLFNCLVFLFFLNGQISNQKFALAVDKLNLIKFPKSRLLWPWQVPLLHLVKESKSSLVAQLVHVPIPAQV